MGKKKIEKAPKTPKAQEDHSEPEPDQEPHEAEAEKEKVQPAKVGKKGKGKPAKQATESKPVKQAELFPEDFLKKVQDFKTFYQSYLQLRASSEESDLTNEFKNVSDKVKAKISVACSKVLRQDVSDAQKWIDNKKASIEDQIRSVDSAESETRNALQKSGTFTEAEIDGHLTGIRDKRNSLKKCVKDLELIQSKAGEIYKSDGMDLE